MIETITPIIIIKPEFTRKFEELILANYIYSEGGLSNSLSIVPIGFLCSLNQLKLPANLAVFGSKSEPISGKYPTSYTNSTRAQTAISFFNANPRIAINPVNTHNKTAGIYHNESSYSLSSSSS